MKNLLLVILVALTGLSIGCSKKDKKNSPVAQDYVYTQDYRIIQYVQQRYGNSPDIIQPAAATSAIPGQQQLAYNIRRDVYNEAVAAVGTTGTTGINGQGGYCYSRTLGNLNQYCQCIQQTYYGNSGGDIINQCINYCSSNPSHPDCYAY